MITSFIVNSIFILLILFVMGWFWFAKATAVTIKENVIEIDVANGVYTPSVIKAVKDKAVILRFFRRDASPCAEWVQFPDLNVSEQLPLNKPHTISLEVPHSGRYPFHCQMNMYRGVLIVE